MSHFMSRASRNSRTCPLYVAKVPVGKKEQLRIISQKTQLSLSAHLVGFGYKNMDDDLSFTRVEHTFFVS
jgi:hypothetical protein